MLKGETDLHDQAAQHSAEEKVSAGVACHLFYTIIKGLGALKLKGWPLPRYRSSCFFIKLEGPWQGHLVQPSS